jgi:hypothetical protein
MYVVVCGQEWSEIGNLESSAISAFHLGGELGVGLWHSCVGIDVRPATTEPDSLEKHKGSSWT